MAVAGAALIGAFFAGAANRLHAPLLVIDAIALGLFSTIGAQGGLTADLPIPAAILLGTITGVGGSVVRDLLVGETPPRMLRRGPPYASAALLGASVYVALVAGLGEVPRFVAQILAVVLVLLIRVLAWWRGWESPEPHDLTPAILRARARRPQGVAEASDRGDDRSPSRVRHEEER